MYKAHRPGTCCEARKNCEPLICDLEKFGNCWIMVGTETLKELFQYRMKKCTFQLRCIDMVKSILGLAAHTLPACLAELADLSFGAEVRPLSAPPKQIRQVG